MNTTIKTLSVALMVSSLSACVSMGDLGSVKTAVNLAIDCQTDAALEALKGAEQSGGVAAILSDWEHEAILREAGRVNEADAIKAARDQRTDMTEEDKAKAEKSVLDTVKSIREQREKKTGSQTCPK